MAQVGMIFPVIAPITSHTDGQAITYGTGFVAGEAVSANLSISRNSGKFWGDDHEIDSDNSVSGYSISFTPSKITEDARKTALGEVEVGTSDAAVMRTYDDAPPVVGFGYARHLRRGGVDSYECMWFHEVQFAITSQADQTKAESVQWNTTALEGTGHGVYIDATGKLAWYDRKVVTDANAAKVWLKAQANIT